MTSVHLRASSTLTTERTEYCGREVRGMWISKKRWNEVERRLSGLERAVKPSSEDSAKDFAKAMKIVREHKQMEAQPKC